MEQNRLNIRESRYLNIKGKVIKHENMFELAQMVWNEFKQEEGKQEVEFEIAVICKDNASFKSEDISLLNDKQITQLHIAECIKIYFKAGKNKKINIELKHGNEARGSFIDLTGNDTLWVNGILGKFNELIDSFQDQDPFLIKQAKLLRIIFFITGTLSLGFIIDWLKIDDKNFKHFWVIATQDMGSFLGFLFIACLFGGLVIGMSSFEWAFKKTKELWPTIELQIGPGHKLIEKKKRQNYFFISTLFIIPIIVSIISAFITGAL